MTPRNAGFFVLESVSCYTDSNGRQNRPVMWARDRQKAIEIITAYCAVKGWEVTSIE